MEQATGKRKHRPLVLTGGAIFWVYISRESRNGQIICCLLEPLPFRNTFQQLVGKLFLGFILIFLSLSCLVVVFRTILQMRIHIRRTYTHITVI